MIVEYRDKERWTATHLGNSTYEVRQLDSNRPPFTVHVMSSKRAVIESGHPRTNIEEARIKVAAKRAWRCHERKTVRP